MIALRSFIGWGKTKRRYRYKDNVDSLIPLNKYDFVNVMERVMLAIFKTGRSIKDVAVMFGMNPSVPYYQQIEIAPPRTMRTIIRLSDFLGVSVRWILTGETENEIDLFVSGKTKSINNAVGSVIVQDNQNSKIEIIHHDKGE